MKLKALTGACLLALGSTPVLALSPAVTGSATTTKIFMSGASAPLATISQLIGTMCSNTPDQYLVTGNANIRGVSCTVKAGVSTLAGKNVFVSYNADGGSGNGVYPLAKLVDSGGAFTNSASNQRPQIIDPASCTGASPTFTCAAGTLGDRWSDAGVSDVEPAMFAFDLNKPSAFANTTLEDFERSNLNVGGAFQIVFGIAATNNLYNDLATAQGLSVGAGQVPSISRTAISSILGGFLSDPAAGLGWQALFTPGTLPAGTAVTGPVNVGRRVNGSGTQTAANAYFLDYGCSPTANLTPADALSSVPGKFVVNEGSGTSNVITFLNGRNTAGQYAIGLVSKENTPASGAGWKHVAIDGQVPSRDNAKNGKYEYVYEITMQWNTPYLDNHRTAQYPLPIDVTAADLTSFLTSFRARAGAPLVLDLLSPAAQEGTTAILNEGEGFLFNDPAVTPEGVANKKFVSRMTRNGNSCQKPLWLQ